jgi:hypothetical protein
LEEPDQVSENTGDHHPEESTKGTVTLSKGSQAGGGRSRAFEPIMSGYSVFDDEQSFYSIMIIVPFHVSKFSRVLKKLPISLKTVMNINFMKSQWVEPIYTPFGY